MLLPVLRLALVAAAAVAATLFYSEVGNLRFILQTTSSNKSSCFVSSPTLLSERAPLHVFVRDGIESAAMEMNFWILLLQQLGRPLVMHSPSDQLIVSNSIVFCFDASPFADSVAAEMQNGTLRNVGLFHAGDENGASSTAQLHYGKFSFVFRSYWLEKIFSSDVPRLNRHLEWVPNGPRSNSGLPFVRSSLLPAHKRKHLCSCKTNLVPSFLLASLLLSAQSWAGLLTTSWREPCLECGCANRWRSTETRVFSTLQSSLEPVARTATTSPSCAIPCSLCALVGSLKRSAITRILVQLFALPQFFFPTDHPLLRRPAGWLDSCRVWKAELSQTFAWQKRTAQSTLRDGVQLGRDTSQTAPNCREQNCTRTHAERRHRLFRRNRAGRSGQNAECCRRGLGRLMRIKLANIRGEKPPPLPCSEIPRLRFASLKLAGTARENQTNDHHGHHSAAPT